MLNPSFSKALQATLREPYVASTAIANRTVKANMAFDTGEEYRLQPVYGEEIGLKLQRAGLSAQVLNESVVLEVCAGTGFLTYHLLSQFRPRHITVNEISAAELGAARTLVRSAYPDVPVNWVLGDMHTVNFGHQFDVIVGNSFIHHLYDVPRALRRFAAMLRAGGVFVSLHEPTPMATVVEGARIVAYPLAVLAPKFANNIARARYIGEPSATDLWMFEPKAIAQIARQAGFSSVTTTPWGLVRPIVVQRGGLHLSKHKPRLSMQEERAFRRAISLDSYLNRLLPDRCFGSICLICRK